MDTTIQEKIKKCVADYISIFPHEYTEFIESLDQEKLYARDDFGSTREADGQEHILERKTYAVPVELYNIIIDTLTEEENREYFNSTQKSKEYQRWFARQFPQFSYAQKI